MMGHQKVEQAALFYEFSLERHVPTNHLLRSIDRFVELGELRRELSAFYSTIGRPSIAPELMIRMLLVGYCFGIRSERRLCEEVHLNLAYRWFCRLGLDGDVPDHSTFSKNRHGRSRESDLLRTTGSRANDGATLRYRATKFDCQSCRPKPRCCPKEPARYVPRSIYEGARDMARQIARSWEGRVARRLRKKVEKLFAHLKRILKLDRLRLRGPNGARDEFLLAAAAQNLRKLAKLIPMPSPHPA